MNFREWALPVYTVLTELAAGVLLILWVVRSFFGRKFDRQRFDQAIENPLLLMVFTIAAGMLGAHFHLSKPWLSFLALLNIRSSWLSREIASTLLFFVFTAGVWYLLRKKSANQQLVAALGWVAVFFGLTTIYTMSRIYMLPTQVAWSTPFTVVSFYCTSLLLGFMALPALLVMDMEYSRMRNAEKGTYQEAIISQMLPWFAVGAVVVMTLLVGENIQQLIQWGNSSEQTALVSIMLLSRLYPLLFGLRLVLIVVGVVGISLLIYWTGKKQRPVTSILFPAYVICLLVMIGEILGRFLFYATHVRIGI